MNNDFRFSDCKWMFELYCMLFLVYCIYLTSSNPVCFLLEINTGWSSMDCEGTLVMDHALVFYIFVYLRCLFLPYSSLYFRWSMMSGVLFCFPYLYPFVFFCLFFICRCCSCDVCNVFLFTIYIYFFSFSFYRNKRVRHVNALLYVAYAVWIELSGLSCKFLTFGIVHVL